MSAVGTRLEVTSSKTRVHLSRISSSSVRLFEPVSQFLSSFILDFTKRPFFFSGPVKVLFLPPPRGPELEPEITWGDGNTRERMTGEVPESDGPV